MDALDRHTVQYRDDIKTDVPAHELPSRIAIALHRILARWSDLTETQRRIILMRSRDMTMRKAEMARQLGIGRSGVSNAIKSLHNRMPEVARALKL